MLVLTRGPNESLLIGDNVVITVLNVSSNERGTPQVRIGIEAPREITVLRDEVARREQKAKAQDFE